jgi:hypothetical protein
MVYSDARKVAMALSEFTLKLVEKKLGDYCRGRVHEALCHRVRIGYAVEGDLVTLFEERRGLLDPEKRVRLETARFRFDGRTKSWSLYYVDTDSAWHSDYLKPRADIEILLREIDEDPVRVFWWGEG